MAFAALAFLFIACVRLCTSEDEEEEAMEEDDDVGDYWVDRPPAAGTEASGPRASPALDQISKPRAQRQPSPAVLAQTTDPAADPRGPLTSDSVLLKAFFPESSRPFPPIQCLPPV